MTNMTAKSNKNFRYSVDKDDIPVNIGDEIVYAKYNNVKKTYILGFTPKGIYVLDDYWVFRDNKYIYGKRKTYKRYLDFLLYKKNVTIPEELMPFL